MLSPEERENCRQEVQQWIANAHTDYVLPAIPTKYVRTAEETKAHKESEKFTSKMNRQFGCQCDFCKERRNEVVNSSTS